MYAAFSCHLCHELTANKILGYPHSITKHVNFCRCMNLLLNILINKKIYVILYLNISLDLGGCLKALYWLCGLKIKKLILLITIILTIMILFHLATKLFLSRSTERNPQLLTYVIHSKQRDRITRFLAAIDVSGCMRFSLGFFVFNT